MVDWYEIGQKPVNTLWVECGILWCRAQPYAVASRFQKTSRWTAIDSSWNVMAHCDVEGNWRGNLRMEWVTSTLHTTSEHGVSSITTADSHTSAASSRLNWRPPADLNWLVRFAERRNLVSARVPSHFNWPVIKLGILTYHYSCSSNNRGFQVA